MASRSTVLIAKDISKSYGDRIIIDHLSLTVHEGEAVALTGRNGAGKSTVLRMLVGADRPSSGTIEVLGKKVSETNPEFRRNVATVIDDLDFFPDLSVVEHLDLLARAHGLVDADALVDEVLEEVQLALLLGQQMDVADVQHPDGAGARGEDPQLDLAQRVPVDLDVTSPDMRRCAGAQAQSPERSDGPAGGGRQPHLSPHRRTGG